MIEGEEYPGESTSRNPLFLIEVQESKETREYVFNINLDEFTESVGLVLSDGVKALAEVNLIERKLLSVFFNSELSIFIKSPVLLTKVPYIPTYEERRKGAIPDENIWVWEYYTKFKSIISESIV